MAASSVETDERPHAARRCQPSVMEEMAAAPRYSFDRGVTVITSPVSGSWRMLFFSVPVAARTRLRTPSHHTDFSAGERVRAFDRPTEKLALPSGERTRTTSTPCGTGTKTARPARPSPHPAGTRVSSTSISPGVGRLMATCDKKGCSTLAPTTRS